ncbi:4'-phosphopantetheinyl transferase family protein [Streptomyces aidingensis]|uniref:4'-phosphopantetheinyl transferase n=1 Tax=Streptomyces aidingensis TaxID=910347 RepID=A0A1I1SHT1_9ACTN|nr:4'-phosphopantetheinyl transferase family protein [Streptomyces aidingensis]SFD45991.1 4'-phosphopantetheinyl transferase [Streptomyces aidingensis]
MEPGEAHLWYVDPLAVRSPAVLDAYRALLTPEELASAARIRPWAGRHTALVARGLLRTLLSRYCPAVPPADWRFAKGRYGRPEIEAPAGHGRLRFNLTHTDGLAACLLVPDVDCGVDAEALDRAADVDILVPSTLTAREAAALAATPPEERTGRFFRHWTLKEAYAKARGLGLQLPFQQFGFDLGPADGRSPGAVTAHFGAELADRPDDWQFAQWTVAGTHVLAVALRRPAGGELRIVRHHVRHGTRHDLHHDVRHDVHDDIHHDIHHDVQGDGLPEGLPVP